MLGRSKKEMETKNQSNSPVSKTALNSIVHGTKVEGTLHANSDIRIDGEVKGKLICTGKIIVGTQGKVDGEISCENAVIEGTIIGNFKVKELLNVRETGRIEGDINYGKINVQSGGVIMGTCNMGAVNTTMKGKQKMAAVN